MQLIIMRHGQAESIAPQDSQRRLTAKGEGDVAIVAKQLITQLSDSVKIYYSPFVRTTQTAGIVLNELTETRLPKKVDEFQVEQALICGADVDSVIHWLENQFNNASGENDSVILVSHQPLVSRLVGWLVEGAGSSSLHRYSEFEMYPASTAMLQLDYPGKGCAQLLTMFHV